MAFTAVEGSESATLVGMFFIVEGDEGWQGYVEKSVGPEHYVVQLYSWNDGEPTECKVISIRDAEKRNWSWFFEREAWAKFGSMKFAQGIVRSADPSDRDVQRMIQAFKVEDSIGLPRSSSFPIKAFVADRCVLAPGATVTSDALFFEWTQWAIEQGRDRAGSKAMFGRNLSTAFPEIRVIHPRVDGGRERHYEGIGLARALVETLEQRAPTEGNAQALVQPTPDELALFNDDGPLFGVCPICHASLGEENSSLVTHPSGTRRVHFECGKHE